MKKFHVALDEGEDGYFVVYCPELPGCVSQGKTKREALKNIKEAIELYVEAIEDKHQAFPKVEVHEVVVSA